jgi:hypothetical protein
MELWDVVPPRRRLPGIGAALRQMDRDEGPTQGVGVCRQIRAESDLDPCPDLARARFRFDDGGRAVALWLEFELLAATGDGEKAVRRQHRAGDHSEAVAECAPRWQAQELGRD